MGCDWRPLRKDGLPGAYFHETGKCQWTLCANLVDQISPISNILRGMNDSRFIYVAEKGHCADFQETQNLSINICGYPYRPTKFYRNRMKNVENTSNFFKPVSKEYVLLTGFSEIYKCSAELCGYILHGRGTRWRSRLGPRTTSRKVAGSIPDSVIGIFHWQNHSGRTMTLGVNSASNRNEYQEYFLGGKGGQCVRLTALLPSCADFLETW
jgi:hypothetical protein